MVELTLARRRSPLADPVEQLRILENRAGAASFDQTLCIHGTTALKASAIEVLQINVGRLCNQTCRHCHVDAGPDRREVMTRQVMEQCIDVLRRSSIPIVDITGGAPEMNPEFRWLVRESRRLGRRVIDRCNLTILVAAGFDDLPEFLAGQQVDVVASLPCYLEENVDRQRGDNVFRRSIEGLKRLNALGYGQPGSDLILNLVFNPIGPKLPPDQSKLEAAYRRELRDRYGVEFTNLYTITNMPISRFLDDLLQTGEYDAYMQTLVASFNPATVSGLMCRTTLSVDWQGYLYDCDFNQMLNLKLLPNLPQHVRDLDDTALAALSQRRIVTGQHCYGCTAGAGSSCQGSLS